MPEMTDKEHKEFMDAQIKKIEVDKWLEGERIGRDPGEEYVKKWIREEAAKFRKKWIEEEKNTDMKYN